MSNWKIDPKTEEKWKPFISALHNTIFDKNEKIQSLPGFEKVNDLGIAGYENNEYDARAITVTHNGKEYPLVIHMYNRHNGNCLAVSHGSLGKNLLQLVLDKYLNRESGKIEVSHDGIITGVSNLNKTAFLNFVKSKAPNLLQAGASGSYIQLGVLPEKAKYDYLDKDFSQFIASLLLYSILRYEIKQEHKDNLEGEDEENNTEVVKYSWVQTHKELVEYLSKNKDNQKGLIEILKQAGITNAFKDRDANGETIELEEIDPFSFFCFIYKYGPDRRLAYLQKIAELLQLDSIPTDDSGIPSAQAQKVWLFPYKENRVNNEINRLWDFFFSTINGTITNEQFEDILQIKSVGKTKLTESLFNINPEKYFPIKGPTKPYLKEVLNIDYDFNTYTEYLGVLNKIREKTTTPFYQLSFEAWEWNNKRSNVNYWIFQGNPKVYNIVDALQNDAIKNWTVTAFKNGIKKGDKAIIWATGANAGCYALCEVSSDVYESKSEPNDLKYYLQKPEDTTSNKVDIKVLHNLAIKPITKEQVDKIDELSELKVGNQGTNFAATEDEYNTLLEMAINQNSKKYWLYAPGELAKEWEEFYDNGIIGLGWENLGDLNQYKSKEEIAKRLQKLEKTTSAKYNDAAANYEFKNIISIGDIIIAKKGRGELLGYGIVTSDYIYDNTRNAYKSCRKVEWIKKGNWIVNHSLALKTLTDITNYNSENPKFTYYYETLMALMNADKQNYKLAFTNWLSIVYSTNSGMKSSYLRAMDILSEKLGYDIYEVDDLTKITLLYNELINDQKNETGKYYHAAAPSYGTNGYYSAAISKYSDFIKEYTLNMGQVKNNGALNTILYGPPGTGKTYNTINKAIELIDNSFYNSNISDRTKLKEYFDKNVIKNWEETDKQIVFTTFHQSMSYEDFIEGIKPLKPSIDKSVQYDIEDGIFKKICHIAKSNYENSKNDNMSKLSFEDAFSKLKEELEEHPETKFPLKTAGSDFTVYEITNTSIRFKKASGGTGHTLSIQTLKDLYYGKVYDFKQGVGIYYPSILNKLHTYSVNITSDIKLKNYVLIIDEINRGNISQIFGELITLIEDDKRFGRNEALEITLPYSKESFSVPPNLHILGTMNTADRSVEALDTALRRRFSFIEMMPDYSTINKEVGDIKLSDLLFTINKRLAYLINEDHQIGHSYFISVDTEDKLRAVFKNNIIPLLKEYFYNDVSKIQLVLGEGFVKTDKSNKPNFAVNDQDIIDKEVYKLELINDDFNIIEALTKLKIEAIA